ncbi:cation:proton antiporter [Candidatus Woesearchaeota archaeon]|nr:cation:proton antiporter [Candidatus Woesearchaeota archaeon]
MAAEALTYLTYLGVLLLVGLICTIISSRLRLPNVLLLIIVGILLKYVKYQGAPLFDIPQNFILTLGVLTLIMVVYDSASTFKLKEIDALFFRALKLTMFFIILTLFLFTISSKYMLDIPVFLAVLFSSFMAGTSPDTALSLLSGTKNKIAEFLEIESIVNTPPLVLLPFIIIDLMKTVTDVSFDTVVQQFVPFLQQIVIGLGAGLLVGAVVFKLMSRFYSERVSPIAIVAAALITYVLAENIGGNGVLAVTTMAVIVGNIYIKHKETLDKFSTTFSEFLQILVFILLGLLIDIDWSVAFVLKSAALFFVFLLIRLLSIHISFWSEHTLKEKIFMTINAPKGIATAVVIFLLSTYAIPGMASILDYGLAFILYSIVLATAVIKMPKFFIQVDIVKPAPKPIFSPPKKIAKPKSRKKTKKTRK